MPINQAAEMTLESLLGGALTERVAEAIEEIVRNIDDPNTLASETRQLTVRLVFKPSPARDSAQVAVEVTTKLSGKAPLVTTAFFGYDSASKRYVAREHNAKQERIQFGEPEPPRPATTKGN